MELLLENDQLKFNKDALLEKEIIRSRSAKNFDVKYLNRRFKKNITIIRILDSKNENFKLNAIYKKKIEIIDIITAPEIEMLIIHAEGKFDNYNKLKSKVKPSEYCKKYLKFKNVKTYDFVIKYFKDVNKLVEAIKMHKSKTVSKKSYNLNDLLK